MSYGENIVLWLGKTLGLWNCDTPYLADPGITLTPPGIKSSEPVSGTSGTSSGDIPGISGRNSSPVGMTSILQWCQLLKQELTWIFHFLLSTTTGGCSEGELENKCPEKTYDGFSEKLKLSNVELG